MIEDRVVGIKSREIYETPGLLLLIKAHKELESITLNPDVVDFKGLVESADASNSEKDNTETKGNTES